MVTQGRPRENAGPNADPGRESKLDNLLRPVVDLPPEGGIIVPLARRTVRGAFRADPIAPGTGPAARQREKQGHAGMHAASRTVGTSFVHTISFRPGRGATGGGPLTAGRAASNRLHRLLHRFLSPSAHSAEHLRPASVRIRSWPVRGTTAMSLPPHHPVNETQATAAHDAKAL